MAALVVPETSRTNRPIVVTGTEFEIDTAVAITVVEENFTVSVLADAAGDFSSEGVLTWAPTTTGRYTITADDGTNVETASLQVYSTT